MLTYEGLSRQYYFSTHGCNLVVSSFGAAVDLEELALFAAACRALRSKKLAIACRFVRVTWSEQRVQSPACR